LLFNTSLKAEYNFCKR